jgi:hypothetical protein
MPKTRPPEFLERSGYRLRRLTDAARMLPFFGLVLVCLPLLRGGDGNTPPPTAAEAVYLFGIWFVLVLIAFGMSLGLRRALANPAEIPPAQTPPQAPRPED